MRYRKLNRKERQYLEKHKMFLEWFLSQGFVLSGSIQGESGMSHFSFEDACELLTDELKFAAKEHGVSEEVYERFVDRDGMPQCGATTRKGTRCKLQPVGDYYYRHLSPKEFAELDGQYCAVHEYGK